MLNNFSQSGLLDESFALMDALAPQPGLASSERWWQSAARLQLHDELFRYFLALPLYATGPKEYLNRYTEAPKIALNACLTVGAATAQPPSKAPSLARPVALSEVERRRTDLRQLVSLQLLKNQLENSFGNIINAGTTSSDRPAVLVAAAFDNLGKISTSSSYPIYAVPPLQPSTREFAAHTDVARTCSKLLSENLPFGNWGVSLPTQIDFLFSRLNALDGWLVDGLQLRGSLIGDPKLFPLSIWGLVFSFTARAYLTDFLCSFARVSLPLDRLYEETREGAKTKRPLDSRTQSGEPALTKRVYNAYTAVGLVELLTGKSMPHLDPVLGEGYLRSSSSLNALGVLEPFDAFWKEGGASNTHTLILNELQAAWDKPVLQYQYDPRNKGKAPVALAPLSLDDMYQRILSHAIPSISAPSSRSAKKTSDKSKNEPPKWNPTPFQCCGHFIAHLKIEVAKQLAALLAANTRTTSTSKPKDGAGYIGVGSGSERWGGNHPPHFEHRDGFTFDISNPHRYLPWATVEMVESKTKAAQTTGKGQPKKPKSCGLVLGIPKPKKNELDASDDAGTSKPLSDYVPLSTPDSVTRDETLAKNFREVTGKLIRGEKDVGDLLDTFAGTPVHIGKDGEPDDDLLLPDLIGHVSLALAGVRKWCYASFYEHFFAVRAIADLFVKEEWLTILPGETRVLSNLIEQAEFIWLPIDHHNHWHVVFYRPGPAQAKISSLSPAAYSVDSDELTAQLSVWTTLGVDLSSFWTRLKDWPIANSSLFPGAVKERKMICDLIERSLPKYSSDDAKKKAKEKQVGFLKIIASSIDDSSYSDDIPSLKGTKYREWIEKSDLVRNHRPPACESDGKWKVWPNDVEPSELKPDAPGSSDGVDATA